MLAAVPTRSTPTVTFDPTCADPALVGLHDAVTCGDWPAIAAFFAGVPDPDDRDYVVYVIAETEGSEEFLRAAADRAEPESTLAVTLYAARLVVVGWNVRGGLRAQYVGREQFDTFHDRLRRAERLLIDVTARDPADTSAWAWRLKTARGLELGQAEARRRYDRLARTAPHMYTAQAQLVQQLCPKWGGTFEAVPLCAKVE